MAKEAIRVEGLRGVLDTLKQLPPEVVSKNGGPVRKILRRAAKVIQLQMQANIQAIVDAPNIDGATSKSIGLLRDNIVINRIKMPAGARGEAAAVRIRRRKYPELRVGKSKPKTTQGVGQLLEQGTARRKAYPWARPAFEAKKVEAVQLFERELPAEIDRIVKKLARQNGGAKR